MAKKQKAEKRTNATTVGTSSAPESEFRETSIKPFAFETPGDTLIGYYVATRPTRSKFGSVLHRFVTEDRTPIDAWGSGYLDNEMERVAPGVLCRAQFIAYDEDNSKGNPGKIIKVKINPARRLSVEDLAVEMAAAGRQSAPIPNGKSHADEWTGLPQ